MTDLIDAPGVVGGEQVPVTQHSEIYEIEEERRGLLQRFKEWDPGLKWKAAVGALACSTIVFVGQNLDTLETWEDQGDDNYYPVAAPGCADYMSERDTGMKVSVGQDNDTPVAKTEAEALEFELNDSTYMFDPSMHETESLSDEFEAGGVDLMESFRQAREFFDHKVDSFEMSSGLTVNFYTLGDPDFTINHERFDEVFHAALSPDVEMGDSYYNDLTMCTREGFGLPESREGESLDVFIAPELGYCIAHMRIYDTKENGDKDECIANGGTPPRMLLEFMWWAPLDEEIMVLTFSEGATTGSVNRFLAHEAAHYWLNQTRRQLQRGPEERYIEAMEDTMWVADINGLRTDEEPAIVFSGMVSASDE